MTRDTLKLYVDDERHPPSGWTLAKTFTEAVYALEHDDVEALSLDHDLGTEKTGYDIACWLEEQVYIGRLKAPRSLLIHSANPVGRNNIARVFESIRRIESELKD